VFLTNNLFVFDGVTPIPNLIHENFNVSNNILRVYNGSNDENYNDLGFADITGTTAADFDLVDPNSPAIDAGADISDNGLDYFNRARSEGEGPDIGALEHGASQAECIPLELP
ncbi:MAG: choice-of-anchor Q domain-containing protein, partial [Desulfobacteraceae bacterium]